MEKFGNFWEMVHTYCKAVGGDPDNDVHLACNEIMEAFDKADGNKEAFKEMLVQGASYTSWTGK